MKKILLLFLAATLFACNNSKEIEKTGVGDFSVALHKKIDGGDQTLYTFRILDSIPEELKGIPDLDTMKLQYFKFKSSLQNDSIQPKQIYAYTGYENGKYVMAYDLNFNKDLSDDQKHYFNRQFGRWKRGVRYDKETEYDTLTYNEYFNSQVTKNSLIYKMMPNDSSIVHPNNVIKTELVLRMLTYNHWWYGTFSLNEKEYKVAVSRSWNGMSYAFATKEDDFSTRMDYDFVEIKLKDTIQLGASYFRIDTINSNFSELFLKDLKLKEKPTGFAEGDKIKDLKFNDIRFRPTSFSRLIGDKEYLLIDFWGTWCAPCLKLNPEVIQLNKDHAERLSILSLSYDDEKSKVFEHIKNYNMDWNHVFLQRNLKGGLKKYPKILKDLRIEAFPTFILLDKQLNILVRGTGKEALTKTKEILAKAE